MDEHLFDMGDLRFLFVTPLEQEAIIMPQPIFFIESSEAAREGHDLGRPVPLEENPNIGGISLSTRPE